jgi:hypothetical protein
VGHNDLSNYPSGGKYVNMENEKDETSKGLNQIFEIINAKGDAGELKNIVEKDETTAPDENQSNHAEL